MNFRLRLSSILVFALSSIVMPRAQEYVVGPAAFDIGQAQQNCQSIGRDLAGFDEPADLDTIIALCQGTPPSTIQYCYLRYVVNDTQDDHVSILDGTPMPDASGYFEGPPIYPKGFYVMARTQTSFLVEQRSLGWSICQRSEPPLFADGFEGGNTQGWSSSTP